MPAASVTLVTSGKCNSAAGLGSITTVDECERAALALGLDHPPVSLHNPITASQYSYDGTSQWPRCFVYSNVGYGGEVSKSLVFNTAGSADVDADFNCGASSGQSSISKCLCWVLGATGAPSPSPAPYAAAAAMNVGDVLGPIGYTLCGVGVLAGLWYMAKRQRAKSDTLKLIQAPPRAPNAKAGKGGGAGAIELAGGVRKSEQGVAMQI